MKKLVVVLVLVAVGLFLVKKTSLGSWASLIWCSAQEEIDEQVPTATKLKLLRKEIDRLQGDIRKALRPIAEEMAKKEQLEKDLELTEAKLTQQKETIVKLIEVVGKAKESKEEFVNFGSKRYSLGFLNEKLIRDDNNFKTVEKQLKSQRKSLEAAERSLAAYREQLTRLIQKKQDYEIQLCQLEAEEAELGAVRIGSKLHVNSNRASKIEALIAKIKHKHAVERAEIALASGEFANGFIPELQTAQPNVNLKELQNYYAPSNGKSGEKTVAQK
jgi:peptidoglycan hydrolase CwlO-like protein